MFFCLLIYHVYSFSLPLSLAESHSLLGFGLKNNGNSFSTFIFILNSHLHSRLHVNFYGIINLASIDHEVEKLLAQNYGFILIIICFWLVFWILSLIFIVFRSQQNNMAILIETFFFFFGKVEIHWKELSRATRKQGRTY